MRLFLVGFMGAGKSTTGRALARRLGSLFVDLDARIEAVRRRDVAAIFRDEGEGVFRAEESRQLSACARYRDVVVATGGGTFASDANRAVIARLGTSVFLDTPWGEIVRRLPGKRDERPLFTTPEQALDLYRARIEHYRRADLHLRPGTDEDADTLAGRIIFLIGEHG